MVVIVGSLILTRVSSVESIAYAWMSKSEIKKLVSCVELSFLTQGLLPHPLRDRFLQGPRTPRKAHKEDREVPPPPLRPTMILGPREPRVHPHRPCRQNPQ